MHAQFVISLTSNTSLVNQVSSSDGGKLFGSEGGAQLDGGPIPNLCCGGQSNDAFIFFVTSEGGQFITIFEWNVSNKTV